MLLVNYKIEFHLSKKVYYLLYNEMLHGIMLDVVIKPTPFTKSL